MKSYFLYSIIIFIIYYIKIIINTYIYIMLNQPKTINQVGKKVGDYKFIKFLGMGSFAEVIK
jgi:hypothetical protein